MWGLRTAMRKRSIWRTVQFATLRLRLIKIAARITELKTLIRVQWPTACPYTKYSGSPSIASRASSTDQRGRTPKSSPSRQPSKLQHTQTRFAAGRAPTHLPLPQIHNLDAAPPAG